MNVLFWNIRGIGNSPSQNMLRKHCITSHPQWLAIAEPKVPFDSIHSSYWNSLGYRLAGFHTSSGFLPNIWVLEHSSLDTSTMIFSSSQMIVIQVVFLHHTFLIAFIHADNDYIRRRVLWNDIQSLPSLPLLLVGDFNSVLGAHERSNGSSPARIEIQEFTDFINNGNLLEPASSGCFFTWSNHHFTHGYMESRIDRVLATNSFMDIWEAVSYHVGIRNCSDHSPLLVSCSSGHLRLPRPFRFQNMWLSHKAFEEVVRASWTAPLSASGACAVVMGKLKRLKCCLRFWNVEVFGHLSAKLSAAQARIEEVQGELADSGPIDSLHIQEKEALEHYNSILDQEATFLRQKSRSSWLQDGDRNTAFFHRSLKVTKGHGGIASLLINDELTGDRTLIRDHVVSYYEGLFRQDVSVAPSFHGMESLISNLVSDEQNRDLTRTPTADEIKHVVFGMNPDSAPGPDGFGGKFYQRMWHIVGEDVANAVRSFFIHGEFPSGFNASFVTLIPKLKDATRIEDFRPIVLGNFLYKIITKILSDRLGSILSNLLSYHQFGFIPGRRIHDCIALASEGVNSLGLRCMDGNMVIKIDIRKAFDTLNWDFLLEVLRIMNFSDSFIAWVRFILHSARLSVLINGAPEGYFSCSQGVRQGDPLSPLLFCLAEEIFSRLLTHSASIGELSPLFLGRNITFPSHLLYADDVIVFCRASTSNCRTLLKILRCYKDWSGQSYNPAKSRVYFSSCITPARTRRLGRILGIGTGSLPFSYLGVPLFVGVPRRRHLQGIADGIIAKFARWKGSSLSMAGRICLVHSVIQGAFVHSMMVYRWPKYLLRFVESRMRNFVFTGDILKIGTIRVSWKRCCAPKGEGGLGLRSMVAANNSFLSRFTWDVLNQKAPYMSILLDRFFSHGQLRSYVRSSIWFGFKDSYPALINGSRWLVGSNSQIRFWLDNWLGYCIADRIEIPTHLRHHFDFAISDYVTNDSWDLIPEFVAAYPEVAYDIFNYQLAPAGEDTRIWTSSRDGTTSSAIFYQHLRPSFPTVNWGDWIWSSYIPPRRSITTWKAIHNKLPTLDNLRTIGFMGPSICIFCMSNEEDMDHMLVRCTFTHTIWLRIFDIFHLTMPDFNGFHELVLFAMARRFSTQVSALWRLVFVTLVWILWSTRNRWIFENKQFSISSVLHRLLRTVHEQGNLLKGTMYNSVDDLMTLHTFGITGCSRPPPVIKEVHWIPPSSGWIKCNTDGSAKGAPGDAIAAGVFRDAFGVVKGCFVQHLGRLFAFEAELAAVMYAIEIAVLHGWNKLWLETDSAYVEGLLLTRSNNVPWQFRNRWLRVLALLGLFDFKITHIYREGNAVADTLSNHHTDGYWPHQIDCIVDQVLRDASGQPYFRFMQH